MENIFGVKNRVKKNNVYFGNTITDNTEDKSKAHYLRKKGF